uniref:Exportin-T n=1 Tax=Mesocestoides corti TaxID=53468 RepID=A0A5K3FJE1_MESCO
MNDFFASLQTVSLTSENGCTSGHQNLINLIEHFSTDNNWEMCASYVISELEKCTSQQQVTDLQNSAAHFVCCRCIETFLKSPSTQPILISEVQKMSEFLRKWVKLYASLLGGQVQSSILKRKIAQTVCLAVIRYYPTSWSSLFDEMLGLFSELDVQQSNSPFTKSCPTLLTLLDVFLEVLQELDSFIFSRQVQLTPEELTKATLIKDTMRVTCLPSIIQMLIQVLKGLQVNQAREFELICFSLQVIGLYALWIDIKLVVNEEFVNILRTLVQCTEPKLHQSLCLLLKGLVTKGMASFPDKLSLILSLWPELLQPLLNSPCIAKVLAFNSPSQNPVNGIAEEDADDVVGLLQEFSSLFGSVGYNLTEAYRALVLSNAPIPSNTIDTSVFSQPTSNWQAAVDQCLDKLEAVADIAISLLAYSDSDVSQGVVMFIGDYLGLLKNNQLDTFPAKPQAKAATLSNGAGGLSQEKSKVLLDLTSDRLYRLQRLLGILMEKIKYPNDAGAEDLEEFEEDRHEYLTIVRSIARIDGGLVLDAIQSFLQHILLQLPTSMGAKDAGSEALSRLEACLFLFFSIGEFYKAPRNDHFAQGYVYSAKMNELMTNICCSNVSSIEFFPVQLDFFEIIGRYDKFFNSSSKLLYEVLAAFLDARGLRNPNVKVRCRCAYLFSRFVKSHKSMLAPHAEQILQQLEGLLPLDPTPQTPESKGINGFAKPPSVPTATGGGLFSITEQSFLYESSANLILARQTNTEGGHETAQLFAMLLRPILLQFPQLVRLLAGEKDPELAEARGIVVKQAADLITRTTRVMSAQTPPQAELVHIFMEILNVMVGSLALLPTAPGSPGRTSACAGIRAFLHRLIGSIGPECNVVVKTGVGGGGGGGSGGDGVSQEGSTASNLLLLALSTVVPQLIDVHSGPSIPAGDPDIRWRELREHMPLFSQVAARYKDRSVPFLTECLPPLIAATLNALAEPLHESQLVAIEERKSLRRGLLQMLYGIGQVLPQGVLVALGSDAASVLASIVSLIEACLEADDAVGMKAGFSFFVGCITNFGGDEAFYKEFLLPHLLPLAFLCPARPAFRLTDAQFSLALNEAASCVFAINSAKGEVFQQYLRQNFLPQQNLSTQYIELYMNRLLTSSLPEFQEFVKNFYSSFH